MKGEKGSAPSDVALTAAGVSSSDEAAAPPLRSHLAAYFAKWAGAGGQPLPCPPLAHLAMSFFGAFLGILAISGVDHLLLRYTDAATSWLVPSFGASAVLVYALPESPLSQPRNLVGKAQRLLVCLWDAPTHSL